MPTCLSPGTTPSSTKAIVVSFADGVKRRIKVTKRSPGGVLGASGGAGTLGRVRSR